MYSSRRDIPKYLLKNENSMVGIIVNRILPPVKSTGKVEGGQEIAVPLM
jgi:hypothetical protein